MPAVVSGAGSWGRWESGDMPGPGMFREILMGVGNGVASVIMLTFTKMPGPLADFYKDARPPC